MHRCQAPRSELTGRPVRAFSLSSYETRRAKGESGLALVLLPTGLQRMGVPARGRRGLPGERAPRVVAQDGEQVRRGRSLAGLPSWKRVPVALACQHGADDGLQAEAQVDYGAAM